MTFKTNTVYKPITNVGVGLRAAHVDQILRENPKVNWFELLADNHMVSGGVAREQALQVSMRYPVTLHCVGMSIGSVEPINFDYLKRLKNLMYDIEPAWVSDHLCWSSLNGIQSHDLLPLPYTEEALKNTVSKIEQIQDYLNTQILIENVSSYLTYKHSAMEEWEFLRAVSEQADCFILLDLNNIYVSHFNHGYSINDYLAHIPFQRVKEIHLAGYEDRTEYLLDAHNNPVSDAVWHIYRTVSKQYPTIPVLIEWDNDLPDLNTMLEEANKAEMILQQNSSYAA